MFSCSVEKDRCHQTDGASQVILAAVRADGFALAYATQELQGDEDVVDAACAENPLALQYASDRWRCEKDDFYRDG